MPPKPPLTHFLCLPLVTPVSRPQLQTSLSRFGAEVSRLDDNGKPQIPELALRPVGTIHFTLGVMNLQTPERIQTACEFLKSLDMRELLRNATFSKSVEVDPKQGSESPPRPAKDSTSTDQPLEALLPESDRSEMPPRKLEPLTIDLANLSAMHAPIATSSLYASPKPLHPIYSFGRILHDLFLAAGMLLPPQSNRPLKLHATLVNTIYTKKSAVSGKNRWGKGSGKIDARSVIEEWGETTWAEHVRIEKVAICEMGAKKVKNGEGNVIDEVYTEIASASLP